MKLISLLKAVFWQDLGKKAVIFGFIVPVALYLIQYRIAIEPQSYFRTIEEVPPAEVAIVLGAKAYKNGVLSLVLGDRVDTGIELYRKGKVKKLLMTGDHGQVTYDEVNSMRLYAESRGVPAKDIFMDHAGFSTYDSMYRARDVFKVQKAIIVTQDFHLPRALYTARELGIDAFGVKADKRVYPGGSYSEGREKLARFKAFLQIHILHSKPRYLGPAIPISGDGRATRDI